MKKKLFAMVLSVAMVFGLTACGGGGSDDGGSADAGKTSASYTVRIGMPTAGKHFSNFTAEQFKAAVEEATEGDIEVQIYPSSQLGTATQMLQGVQDASIEAVMIPSSYFASFAPASAVADIPFLFEDSEQIFKVLNDEANPLNAYLEKNGFKVASWMKNTPRYILSQKKYESVKDLAKEKIWCLPSTMLQDELKAYGGAPQTLDPADIAVSLENGTVDGVETDVIFMNSQGLGNSAKYLNQIPATPMVNLFCFSSDWFNGLPEDYQTLLIEKAQDVVNNQEVEYVEKMYNGSLKALGDAGVEVVEPSDALVAELKKASESVVDSFVSAGKDNEEIYKGIKALIEK